MLWDRKFARLDWRADCGVGAAAVLARRVRDAQASRGQAPRSGGGDVSTRSGGMRERESRQRRRQVRKSQGEQCIDHHGQDVREEHWHF